MEGRKCKQFLVTNVSNSRLIFERFLRVKYTEIIVLSNKKTCVLSKMGLYKLKLICEPLRLKSYLNY